MESQNAIALLQSHREAAEGLINQLVELRQGLVNNGMNVKLENLNTLDNVRAGVAGLAGSLEASINSFEQSAKAQLVNALQNEPLETTIADIAKTNKIADENIEPLHNSAETNPVATPDKVEAIDTLTIDENKADTKQATSIKK
jgi:hypothetical protein